MTQDTNITREDIARLIADGIDANWEENGVNPISLARALLSDLEYRLASLSSSDGYTLTRNHNGDALLMEDGKAVGVVKEILARNAALERAAEKAMNGLDQWRDDYMRVSKELEETKILVGNKCQEVAALESQLAALQLPADWKLEESSNCYRLLRGTEVVANLAGPDAEANAAILANALSAPASEQRDELQAAKACAIKYLGWLGVKNPAEALESDMRNPEMVSAPQPAIAGKVPEDVSAAIQTVIDVATGVPEHKKDDAEFLRASLALCSS